MAGLEAKLGGLLSSVQHVSESLEKLEKETKLDHDKLIALESQWKSERRTIFDKIDEVKKIAEAALAQAQQAEKSALEAAQELVDALRLELQDGVKVRSDRWFHVIMAIGGVATSILTAWLLLKFGLSGGGSHASHGGG